MPRNYFTDEQIEELKKSTYVVNVSKANVVFSEEFKSEFLKLYSQGIGPSECLRTLGVNPVILGQKRVDSLATRIKKQSKRAEGFSRKVNGSKGKPRKKKLPVFENDNQAAEYYKEYALKLEQELDFLKKIRALEDAHQSSRAKNSK